MENNQAKSAPALLSVNILIVALSKKAGGKCVAGIQVDEHLNPVAPLKFIRPVSTRIPEHDEIAASCVNDIHIGDIVQVDLIEATPYAHQVENVLLAPTKWRVLRRLDLSDNIIKSIYGAPPPPVTKYGYIKSDRATEVGKSLWLIVNATIEVFIDNHNGRAKYKARLAVSASSTMEVRITDEVFCERRLHDMTEGETRKVKIKLGCISLTQKFDKNDQCYFLLAGVLE